MHDEFPISIDLAITPTVEPIGFDQPKGKSRELKPMYPSLYITGAKNLENLPREGYALIHFKRRSITMGDRDGEECCSADLEVHEISLPEKGDSEEMTDIGEALTAMAKTRGLIGGSDEEEEEEEEESLAEGMSEEGEDEEK
jgi:hypothetical protein